MDVYASDKEQAELLKGLWNKYGKALVAGVIIALIGSYAFRYWLQYRIHKSEQASEIYEAVVSKLVTADTKAAAPLLAQLTKDYAKTPYAAAGQLMMAKQAVAQNNWSDAKKYLQWVVENSQLSSLRQVARIRLARVMLENHEASSALAQLAAIEDKAFQPEIDAVKGDVYVALNDVPKARESYQSALQNLPSNNDIKAGLQLKLSNLYA